MSDTLPPKGAILKMASHAITLVSGSYEFEPRDEELTHNIVVIDTTTYCFRKVVPPEYYDSCFCAERGYHQTKCMVHVYNLVCNIKVQFDSCI